MPPPAERVGHVRRNLVANVANSAWTTLLGVAFFPVYIRYLGVEAYGLIGAFTTIQTFAALIDSGMSTTVNREVARWSGRRDGAEPMRDLVRTLEVVYWTLSVVVAIGFAVLSPTLARHWVKPIELTADEVSSALTLMGINFALLWPSTVYLGGLMGLQRQVRMNVAMAVIGGVRVFGAVAVLAFVSATLRAFFMWQIVVSALQTAVVGFILWRSLPASTRAPAFSMERVRAVWGFTTAVAGITLLGVALQQADKLILSNLLTLTAFGYYTFAAAVAMTLARIVGPVHATFFPRFAELAGRGDHAQLTDVYHSACQLVSVAVLPAAVILATFAPQILILWTRDPELVRNTHRLVTVLVIGNALHALMYLPYALQLAHGWTRLAFATNLVSVILLMPATIFAATKWGPTGAAVVWVMLTCGYVFVQVPLMHRRLLRGELAAWYINDVGKPLIACALTTGVGWWLMPRAPGQLASLLALASVSAAALLAAGLSVPWMRAWCAGRSGFLARAGYSLNQP